MQFGRFSALLGLAVINGHLASLQQGVALRNGHIAGENGHAFLVAHFQLVGIDLDGILAVGKLEAGHGPITGLLRPGSARRSKGGKRQNRKSYPQSADHRVPVHLARLAFHIHSAPPKTLRLPGQAECSNL